MSLGDNNSETELTHTNGGVSENEVAIIPTSGGNKEINTNPENGECIIPNTFNYIELNTDKELWLEAVYNELR